MLHFGPLSSTDGHPIREAAKGLNVGRIRVASAFASESGVESLRKLIGAAVFDAVAKEALIGLESGITQPEALDRLINMPKSEVRAPLGASILVSAGMRAALFFHPKVYAFEDLGAGTLVVISGSGNLTYGGLLGNVENFFVWSGSNRDSVAQAFETWWTSAWGVADRVSPSFISAYRAARPAPPVSVGPRPMAPGSGPSATALWQASSLWIELTRRPEGGSFNQVELLLNAHEFFYPNVPTPSKITSRVLEFVDPAGTVFANPNRSVRFNGPPLRRSGNSMWRVYMPTAAEGFAGYQDGDVLVRFIRTAVPNRYLVEIADSRGPGAQAWVAGSIGIATKPGAHPRRMGWA
jgi:hypothetical protein